jgi:hypothetical protein
VQIIELSCPENLTIHTSPLESKISQAFILTHFVGLPFNMRVESPTSGLCGLGSVHYILTRDRMK